jgi:hypothetical protein
VYQEGIHLIESQPQNLLAERAILNYREDQKIRALAQALEEAGTETEAQAQSQGQGVTEGAQGVSTGSGTTSTTAVGQKSGTLDPATKQQIVALLKKGGARAALDIF